jgi:hypothetical protein
MGGVVFAKLGIDDCVAVVAVELGNMVSASRSGHMNWKKTGDRTGLNRL